MQVLGDGSGYGVEQHVNTHTGGEQLGYPGEEFVLRAGIIWAHPHRTHLGKSDPQHKTDHDSDGDDVHPANVRCGPQRHDSHGVIGVSGEHHRPKRESENNDRSNDEHDPIDLGHIALTIFSGLLVWVFDRVGFDDTHNFNSNSSSLLQGKQHFIVVSMAFTVSISSQGPGEDREAEHGHHRGTGYGQKSRQRCLRRGGPRKCI